MQLIEPSDANNASLPEFAKDLKDLEAWLAGKHISYRVFSSNVTLKTAKWSREQKNCISSQAHPVAGLAFFTH